MPALHTQLITYTHIPTLTLRLPTTAPAQLFFTMHDPTTEDRQGNDVGPQYRSVIIYHSLQQKEVAEKVGQGR